MMKKILWFSVSCLMILSLVVASCEEEPAKETGKVDEGSDKVVITEKPATPLVGERKEEVVETTEKPKYGGIFTAAQTADTSNWDATTGFDLLGWQISVTNEPLMAGDWAKGPAGTYETDWRFGAVGYANMCTGQLAESYEIPDNETLIFHIRPGIRWWNKAPANGREFTAEDAAWNIKTQWELAIGNFQSFFPPEERLISVEATDKYTVVLKVPPNTVGIHFWEDGQRCYMMCPELYPTQKEWENALGTGAYMIDDYITGSMMTMTRNPDYWQTDPCGPGKGNQLPYIDGLKFLVIPDLSAREAAFRTGKIETFGASWEEWEVFQNTMDYEFEWVYTYGWHSLPTGRQDKDLPFNDLRVRQAMNLAVDKVEILEGYYQGHGSLMCWPYYDTPAYSDLYIPMEELPTEPTIEGSRAGVQELLVGGNPEKAKQLMAEAGYPNGFKTSIYTSSPTATDLLSVVKEYWAEIGIDLEIKQIEASIYFGMDRARSWEEMWYKGTKQHFLPHYLFEVRPESNDCASFFESPRVREVLKSINENLAIDDQVWRSALKDLTPYLLEESIAVWLPIPYNYNCWQPWLKNYYGATTLGAMLPFHHTYYNWIDVDLKKEMGY